MSYKLLSDTSVLCLDNGKIIPLPANETEGYVYQEWIDAGNTPEPADPIIAPSANEVIIAKIAEMEQSDMTNRGSRELMLRLMEKEGAEKGLNVDQLSAAVPFYRVLKARDAEISALRKQLK